MPMGTKLSWIRKVAQRDKAASTASKRHAWGSERIVEHSWLATMIALTVLLIAEAPALGVTRVILGAPLLITVYSMALFGLRLIKDHSSWAPLYWIGGMTSALACATLVLYAQIDAIWLLYPLCAVTAVIHFPRRVSRSYALVLCATFLLTRFQSVGASDIIEEIGFAAFIVILSYLVEQSRRRESQLMQEVASWAAEADAYTTITGTLTSLQPTPEDITRILKRACPPGVSLSFMRWDAAPATLEPVAAIGPDAPGMRRWSYQIRPESSSMVVSAVRERKPVAASLASANASLLLAGSLPATVSPLRSAAVVPIARQDGELFGILLAISTEVTSVGHIDNLGMLPAIANQFATALENARLYEEAQSRADHDVMTGLYHHRALHMRLNEEVVRAGRSSAPFAILMMDLDRFKLYNETYGHQVGDRIICQAAQTLRYTLRSSDILGRYGGDEFLAILPDTDPAEARQVAQQLIEAIAAENFRPREDAERMPLTLSVGLAIFPRDGRNPLELVASSEGLMNDAKHNGGNRFEVAQNDAPVASPGRTVDLRSFGVLEALVTAVDHKDRYTKDHSDEVATYAQLLAGAIGLPEDRIALLYDAGLLHDVGKVGVPDAVLRKPGRLTDEEFDAMKQHVVLSEALLRCLLPPETDPDVLDAVRCHHERWDGRGYPRGLRGEDVPLIGRIMIVADAVSAMHMDRPYRKGLSPAQIVNELRRGAGSQFDPALVEPFIAAFLANQGLTEDDLATPLPQAA